MSLHMNKHIGACCSHDSHSARDIIIQIRPLSPHLIFFPSHTHMQRTQSAAGWHQPSIVVSCCSLDAVFYCVCPHTHRETTACHPESTLVRPISSLVNSAPRATRACYIFIYIRCARSAPKNKCFFNRRLPLSIHAAIEQNHVSGSSPCLLCKCAHCSGE